MSLSIEVGRSDVNSEAVYLQSNLEWAETPDEPLDTRKIGSNIANLLQFPKLHAPSAELLPALQLSELPTQACCRILT